MCVLMVKIKQTHQIILIIGSVSSNIFKSGNQVDKSGNPESLKKNHKSSKAPQLVCTSLARIFWESSTTCFIYFFTIQVISEKTLIAKVLVKPFEKYFYMKKIATLIPTDLVKNLLYSFFALSEIPTVRIIFSASWWSDNEKYFFIASRTLHQSHGKFNRLL